MRNERKECKEGGKTPETVCERQGPKPNRRPSQSPPLPCWRRRFPSSLASNCSSSLESTVPLSLRASPSLPPLPYRLFPSACFLREPSFRPTTPNRLPPWLRTPTSNSAYRRLPHRSTALFVNHTQSRSTASSILAWRKEARPTHTLCRPTTRRLPRARSRCARPVWPVSRSASACCRYLRSRSTRRSDGQREAGSRSPWTALREVSSRAGRSVGSRGTPTLSPSTRGEVPCHAISQTPASDRPRHPTRVRGSSRARQFAKEEDPTRFRAVRRLSTPTLSRALEALPPLCQHLPQNTHQTPLDRPCHPRRNTDRYQVRDTPFRYRYPPLRYPSRLRQQAPTPSILASRPNPSPRFASARHQQVLQKSVLLRLNLCRPFLEPSSSLADRVRSEASGDGLRRLARRVRLARSSGEVRVGRRGEEVRPSRLGRRRSTGTKWPSRLEGRSSTSGRSRHRSAASSSSTTTRCSG